jgi:hypothetical protein
MDNFLQQPSTAAARHQQQQQLQNMMILTPPNISSINNMIKTTHHPSMMHTHHDHDQHHHHQLVLHQRRQQQQLRLQQLSRGGTGHHSRIVMIHGAGTLSPNSAWSESMQTLNAFDWEQFNEGLDIGAGAGVANHEHHQHQNLLYGPDDGRVMMGQKHQHHQQQHTHQYIIPPSTNTTSDGDPEDVVLAVTKHKKSKSDYHHGVSDPLAEAEYRRSLQHQHQYPHHRHPHSHPGGMVFYSDMAADAHAKTIMGARASAASGHGHAKQAVMDQHGVTSSLEVAFGNRISQAFRDEQQLSTSAKQEHKKRKKDMPKRPLSAYNLFFKDERKRILRDTASPPSEEEQKEELLDSDGNVVMVSFKKRKRRPPPAETASCPTARSTLKPWRKILPSDGRN